MENGREIVTKLPNDLKSKVTAMMYFQIPLTKIRFENLL